MLFTKLDELAEQHRWLPWVTCALGCIVLLSQLLFSVQRLSQTADESTHLYAGFRAWKCGDFAFGPEHPPIARLVGAIPFVVAGGNTDCAEVPPRREAFASLDWLYGHAQWQKLLFEARALVSMFAVGLCVLVWLTAKKMFGYTTALIAMTLLVFEPNVLASGALVTTDMVLACMFVFAIYAFYLFMRTRRAAMLVLTGLATGLTLTAKQSGAVVVPILFALAIADAFVIINAAEARWRRALKNVYMTALACMFAAVVVWALYGFRFSARPDGVPLPEVNAQRGSFSGVLVAVRSVHLLPESYVQGLQTARVLARSSANPVFLLGDVHPSGVWYFFPVAIAVKFTVPVLMLLLLAATKAGALFTRCRREFVFVVLPGAAFLAACMTARMNSGIRHALPVVPFVLIFAAAGCVELTRRFRWVPHLLTGALILHAVSSLHAFPNYLSYANEVWGGPARAYEYMPNNDWGESLWQVKAYLKRHQQDRPCWLASIYLVDIRSYGVPCRQFGGWLSNPVPTRIHGTVVVSSVLLSTFRGAEWLSTFERLTPKDRIGGGTMLVYEGDFDTDALAKLTELTAARRLFSEGNLAAALQHTRRAVEASPEDGLAHVQYCRALVANGAVGLAKEECEMTRAYTLRSRDPLHWDSFDTTQVMLHALQFRP